MTDLIQRLAAFANDLSNTGESDGEELLLSAIEELESVPNKDAEIERLKKAVIDQPGCDTCELDRDLMRKFISETGQAERFGHFVMLGADDPLVTSGERL